MPRTKKTRVPYPFRFAPEPHCRVHGPQGNRRYGAYKPWLRDEFEFRCVYCLTRELWSSAGQNSFSVDHLEPKSKQPKLTCQYDNLVYACIDCNRWKSAITGLLDPCQNTLAEHLRLDRLGRFVGITSEGKRLVEYLRLNAESRLRERTKKLYFYQIQNRMPKEMLRLDFGYPPDLPDLSKLKPPKGNIRPEGLKKSHLARQRRRELPDYY